MSAPELAARLKAAIRGEGEPGHPGEMISVNEAETLIDEVFADHAVQQPNREAARQVIAERASILNDHQADVLTDAILAALPIPATGEAEWQYGRRECSTGRIAWLKGAPRADWWNESQVTWEHVRRQVGPAVEVTP